VFGVIVSVLLSIVHAFERAVFRLVPLHRRGGAAKDVELPVLLARRDENEVVAAIERAREYRQRRTVCPRATRLNRRPVMSAFSVELLNRPGELAQLCEAMAAQGVNLILSGLAHDDRATVAFVVDDEEAARTVLESAGIEFIERPAITVRMDNVPGAGAATFRRLADAAVNMDLILPIRVSYDQFFAVICAQDLDLARDALGDQVVTE
jgi:hypothetical protein